MIGVVTEGVIKFQIDGQPEPFLKTGDTFFESENVRITKFNNESDSTAKFVVFYLLKKERDSTLQVIEKE